MTRSEKKKAKARRAFNAHQSAPPRTPRAGPVPIAQARLRARYTAIKNEHKKRMRRLCTAILGTNLHFRGHIWIPTAEKAAQPDAARLGDIQRDLDSGTAAVFWADGSEWNGVLGGAVAWHAAGGAQAVYYKLGRSTRGSASDAELFAIAAAVAKGRQRVEEGGEVRLVRVYSDAQTLLESLRDGEPMVFGPLDESYFPLRALYEDTDWLVAKGVGVELVWVKGHRGSEGNKIADAAASRAVQEQYTADESAGRGDEKDLEIPEFWKQLGPDWAAEWLYRQRFHE
ncbi:hypothetical protein C7974DRAFT_300811, partial [Boeremia exigua]|uniref:uncharacterized protein n=1 Tax=Boeremia exigua TaxID=749465 RepID=UPI001E8E3A82